MIGVTTTESVPALQCTPGGFAFERLDQSMRDGMSWQGSGQQIVDDLAAQVNNQHGDTWLQQQFWHPARAVRAVMEATMNSSRRAELISRATNFALRAYAGNITSNTIDDLQDVAQEAGLCATQIEQGFDKYTFGATESYLSKMVARNLVAEGIREPFIVPVCNGGLIAGLQTALHFKRITAQDSLIYPIRFSSIKHGDTVPQLTTPEHEVFDAADPNRPIVVLDEDSYTGNSIATVVEHIKTHWPDRRVIGAANADRRFPLATGQQGVWWEHVGSTTALQAQRA